MLRLLALLLLLLSLATSAQTLPATHFKSVQAFINKMVEEHHFSRAQLTLIFSEIKFIVADKNNKKKPKKRKTITWDKYRALSITNERIEDGLEFWEDNLTTLEHAEAAYHVPSEIIVAILGIETNYGNKKGNHPTFKTLTQRAFGNYRRRNFYKQELESFLLMARENVIPPLSIQGSYAGAMGYPQFIASSYRHYAVDFNKDRKIDLFSDPIDAIGSIANYFDQHHWHDGGEITRPILLDKEQQKYASNTIKKPKKSASYWRNKGFNIDADIDQQTKLAFISLPQKIMNETWLTFWNFYVLTRYNHDNRYAMAVYQLSQKLKQKFNLKNHQ